MGLAIRYCDLCRVRISPGDLESGKALEHGNKAYCKECAVKVRAALEKKEKKKKKTSPPRSPKTRKPTRRSGNPLVDSNAFNVFDPLPKDAEPAPRAQGPARKPERRKPTALKRKQPSDAPAPARRPPSARLQQAAERKSSTPWIIGGAIGAGLVVVVVLAVVFSGGGSPGKAKGRKNKTSSAAGDTGSEAENAWREASRFEKEHPDDWEAVRARWEKALEVCRGTAFEERIRARIEEGDGEAGHAGKIALQTFAEEIGKHVAVRDFDGAMGLVKELDLEPTLMDRAMELHARVGHHKRIWEEARIFHETDDLTVENKAARLSLLGEAGLGLGNAPLSEDLDGWLERGFASWSVSGGELFGKCGEGEEGEIQYGESSWRDYVLDFDFRVLKGRGFKLLLRVGEERNAILLYSSKGWKAEQWFHTECVVWGEFAFVKIFTHVKSIYSKEFNAAKNSLQGGFGFHLSDGAQVLFRDVSFRRLDRPGQPFIPLPDRWFYLYRSGKNITGALAVPATADKGTWTVKSGVLKGETTEGGMFMLLGSPSWSRFEFAFDIRELKKGMILEVRLPEGPRGLVSGRYRTAEVEIPEILAMGSAWRKALLRVGETEVVLEIDAKPRAKSAFEPMESNEPLKPIRLGFRASSHAGGRVELKGLRVRVHERGGGF